MTTTTTTTTTTTMTTTTTTTTTATTTTTVEPTEYSVGETGPGGGIIFYKDLNRLVGSQYFEAACVGWQSNCDGISVDPQVARCSNSISGAGGTAIGTGEQNTGEILANCAESPAAELADGYSNSGESDWFLPSKDELNQMYAEKNNLGMGNYYLSSSFYDGLNSYGQYFEDGVQSWGGAQWSAYLRPVRSF